MPYIHATATSVPSTRLPPRLSQTPSPIAIGICSHTGHTLDGYSLNTVAITSPKIASTIHRPIRTTIKNSSRTRGVTTSPARSAIVRPRLRMLTTSDPKSCTAPITIDPTSTHTRAGTHPHTTATAGPTIGPVPAMLVKWCPKTSDRRLGT